MIKTYELTPKVYSKLSRDYQYIGHLYDLMLNNSKCAIDLFGDNNLENGLNKSFLQLLARTVGFEPKHSYRDDTLFAICMSFNEIMKIKGTKEAIECCIRLLMNLQGVVEEYDVEVPTDLSEDSPYTVFISVPSELQDTVLIEDLMDYILPTGFTYTLHKLDTIKKSAISNYTTSDRITALARDSRTLGSLNRTDSGSELETSQGVIVGVNEPEVEDRQIYPRQN